MNPNESKVLKKNVRLKLEKTNAKYESVIDKKRWEKLFEKRDMTMSKAFNEYHPTKQLYSDYNSMLLKREELM